MSQSEDSYGTRKRLTFIREAILECKPGSVLDMGCGAGQVSHPLAVEFPDVDFHGVDSDEASIRFATENCAAPNLSFSLELDAVEREEFGLIIASEVIEHVEAPAEFLLTLRQRLENAGRLVLTLPNGYGPFELAAAGEAFLKLIGVYSALRGLKNLALGRQPANTTEPATLAVSPHINFFSYSKITRLLAQTGFEIERYSPRTFLCGFGFDQIVRGERLLEWNSRIADRLPPFASSDWMFLARPGKVFESVSAYERGLFARIRRRVYEKQCGLG